MKKIGITQRVEHIRSYGETRDCLDQSWVELVERADLFPIMIPNKLKDVASYVTSLKLDGFILTGGNDLCSFRDSTGLRSKERDRLEKLLIELAYSEGMPLLGVCRGMQVITEYFGGDFTRVEGHAGTLHKIRPCGSFNITDYIQADEVNSFHHYTIRNAGSDLEVLARCPDGHIEAVKHKERNILGVMWHPEREPQSDLILRKFFNEK